ncbi:hypothetical protein AALA54_16625, partial [Oscillospiraceae bacterium 44-34]
QPIHCQQPLIHFSISFLVFDILPCFQGKLLNSVKRNRLSDLPLYLIRMFVSSLSEYGNAAARFHFPRPPFRGPFSLEQTRTNRKPILPQGVSDLSLFCHDGVYFCRSAFYCPNEP